MNLDEEPPQLVDTQEEHKEDDEVSSVRVPITIVTGARRDILPFFHPPLFMSTSGNVY